MSENNSEWSKELVAYLKSITRELKFDWSSIANQVRNHGSADLGYGDTSFVTPKTCREVFASDYSVETIVAQPAMQSTTDSTPMQVDGGAGDERDAATPHRLDALRMKCAFSATLGRVAFQTTLTRAFFLSYSCV